MDLRYPIGKLAFDPKITSKTRRDAIAAIGDLPSTGCFRWLRGTAATTSNP